MKRKNDFLFGSAVMIIAVIFTSTGCENPAGSGKEDVSNEQLFADVWAYFGCPEAHNWTDNDGLTENTGFHFYESDYLADVATAETYWDSLPDDKTFYESRWEPWERDEQWDKDVVYELQLHRGEDGDTWFQIEVNYSVEGKNTHIEGLLAVPGKIFEICQNMVNRANKN